jgi:superfamily I DNA/RNA helicase
MYKIARNHRSVPEVVALANRIQRTMTETIPLKMESWRGLNGDHGVTGMMTTVDQRSLAQNIAASIHQDRKKYSLSNVAILVRSGGQVKDLEPELVKLKIPYIIRGAQGFLQTEEVRDILAYLRVAVNPRDYPAFKRSCTTPKRGFGESSLEILRKYAEAEHDGDLVKAATTQGKLMLYLNLIGHLQSHKDNPLECLEQAIKRSGYEKYLETKYKGDKDKIEIKLNNLNRLRETFETLSSETEMSLDDIIFQLVMNGDKEESEEGRVVISTIHSSKGLEWPKVFIFNAIEGQLPHKFSQTEKEIEEERRLFYVACTRAKDHLVLGIPASVVTNYNTTFVAPSRFLFEIGLLKKEQ